jgi:hypothetical protein
MRPRTAIALAAASLLALPAAAPAKGITSLVVCGAGGGCHTVDSRAGPALEGDVAVRRPGRAGSWYLVRARGRISDDTVAQVWTAEWLPGAGVMRTLGGGGADWIAVPARLRTALSRAARGLRARPAATLSPLGPPGATARVVEVYSPADREGAGSSGAAGIVAAILAGVAAAGALGAVVVRRRSGERRAATVDAAAR